MFDIKKSRKQTVEVSFILSILRKHLLPFTLSSSCQIKTEFLIKQHTEIKREEGTIKLLFTNYRPFFIKHNILSYIVYILP